MSEPRDLDTLIAIAKMEEKQTNGSEGAQTAVIHILAEAGGALPVNDLLTRYGVSKQTLAALVDPDLSTDKRRKVRAKLGTIDDQPVIYLSPSGVQAAGRSLRGFSVHPTSQSLGHALAPSRFDTWLKTLGPSLSNQDAELSFNYGPTCRAFSERVISLAWARLKVNADTSGSIGLLTGGLIPDGVITERRPTDERGAQHFLASYGVPPKTIDDLAETTVAWEYQLSERSNGGPLRHKVDSWSAAIETLGVAHQVLWVVELKAARILTSLGVGDDYRRPGQIMVSASDIGIEMAPFKIAGRRWWVLDVPR